MQRVLRGWRRTVPLLVILMWPGAGYGQEVASWWRDLRSRLSNSQPGESTMVVEEAIDPELRGGRLGAAGHDLLRRLDHLLGEQSSPSPPHEDISTAPSGQNPAATQESHAESALNSPASSNKETGAKSAGARASRRETPQNVYRYRGEHGREVFTNIAESVPVVSLESTKMELEHVPLNSELGTEINRRIARVHERLASTPFCEHVRADARTLPPADGVDLEAIWEGYAPIVVCGAALLLMFLITPAMNRRVDPTEWRRVMMFAIPALAVAAGVAQSMMHVGKTVIGLRQAAQICDPQALGSLPAGASPLSARLDLVTTLQKEMARVDSMHHETVRPITRSNR